MRSPPPPRTRPRPRRRLRPARDGEQTNKVAGHPYSKIVNGDDKGLFLNQVDGNPRMGKAFRVVERNDHVLHIYGTGKDRIIIDVPHKSAADAAKPKTTTDTTPSSSSARTRAGQGAGATYADAAPASMPTSRSRCVSTS